MKTEFDSTRLDAELGCLSKSDGSAGFTLNDTSMLCGVYGPGEVKIMKELADRASVSVTYKVRCAGAPATKEREKVLEYTIRSICDGVILTHLHPRTAISIVLQEIQTEGSQLACALNCACLALLDANIPLRYTFVAVTCALLPDSAEIVYFPNLRQEQESLLTIMFVFDSVQHNLISVNTSGSFDQTQFNLLLAAAKDYAAKLFTFNGDLVTKRYVRE